MMSLIFVNIHYLFCIWGKKALQTTSYLLVTYKRKIFAGEPNHRGFKLLLYTEVTPLQLAGY